MPFGMVSGVGRMMGVLDGVVIVKVEGAVLGVNLGHPIETSGDFVAQLCGSVCSDRTVVWGGEWRWPRHSCIRWGPHASRERGCFGDFFGICIPIGLNGCNDVNVFDSCGKN